MSTKEWAFSPDDEAGLYQECLYDFRSHNINPKPATIKI
jgi:hypothetical protein